MRHPFIAGYLKSHTMADVLGSLELQQRHVVVRGASYAQPRLTAWYGSAPYEYSGLRWEACTAPAVVGELLESVERLTGEQYNSCLANYYRDGNDCVGWHADDEPVFGHEPAVASLSLGATRRFLMRVKVDHATKLHFDLDHGSVLYMPPGTQTDWEHTVPRTLLSPGPRLNLTFRRTV